MIDAYDELGDYSEAKRHFMIDGYENSRNHYESC